ncbi:MAG: PorP/SprF family type IX secretion system membrane protein [Crocinitomicaceae bacterium]|nr:PorP/SprF family type IX secretion system membrane protein [Crocinitomicaceae bacterium]
MIKRLFIPFLLLGVYSSAQDIHYTQLQQTPMLVNPAYTGIFQGWERIGVNHKSQWVNAGTKFHTTSVAVDMNFFKPKRGKSAYMGAGLLLYNDIGGDSKFGTKQLLVNLSGIVPIGENQSVSAGLQFGFGQRSGDLTGLTFSSQFNGTEIDPSLPSSEINTLVTFVYPDMGFGASYRYGNHKIGFARDDAFDFKVGVSYFHLNKPELKYRLGYTEKLYGKLGVNISVLKDFPGSRSGMELMFNQFVQGPHNESLLSALYRYRISSGSKTTGLTRDSYLSAGLSFRLKDAISPVVFVEMYGFKFGLSYDVTLSKLSQVTRAGGIEFSLIFTNMDFALFKNRRN